MEAADREEPHAPTREELWHQLGHAIALAVKEDQIVWTIFGVFWAANAVLLVALFTNGDLPKRSVGLVVSLVGVAVSLVWHLVQRRALGWLRFYEDVIRELEEKRLVLPAAVAISGRFNRESFQQNVGNGIRVRYVMPLSALISAALWAWSAWYFFSRP